MLQWTGGARRKMKAAKNTKLKTQREFFDNRKEKQRKMELGEEAGKVHTLADYIRQNLHGGESLDILGLRSLNPTPTDVNSEAEFDAILPEPASAASKPNSGDGEDITLTIPNVSASPVGTLKRNSQDTSSQQPENKTARGGIFKEKDQEKRSGPRRPCAHSTPRVAAGVQQEIRKFLKGNVEISSAENRRNPIHVGNLQTKKVASAPQLKLLDIISDDNKDENCGKRRLPSETYAFFSQDGNDAKEEKIIDHGVLHPQQTFLTSDRDWGDTKNFLNPSLELKNSYDSGSDTVVTETSGLLSRFLSTQKLKSFQGTSSRESQEHDMTKDHLLNSFRGTHNGSHNLYFSDPALNTTKANAKEPQKVNFSKSLFDMDYFHVKQEPQIFDIPDPFANCGNYQAKQERRNYRYLNPGFNICGHQAMLEYPFLPDQSFDWSSFKVDNNFFDQETGFYIPKNDSNTWDNDISSTLMKLKREFCTPDYTWSVKAPSSQNNSRQFGSYDKFRDTIEDFYPNLESRKISDEKFDNLLSPMDGYEVERQYVEADFTSRENFSLNRMRTNRNKFENETLDWNDDGREKHVFSEEWECDLSATWDVPWHQKNIDRARSGGHSDQTQNPTGANSWSQTVDGGTADQFTDDLTSDRNVKQERVLPSEAQVIIAPESLQDRKPFFLPQINNGDEDFIIVCFSDNEDCPAVDANNLHLPIRPVSIPLQVPGTEESSSVMDHNINNLSYETPFNSVSQEIDAFCAPEKGVIPAGATGATRNKLTLAPESSACDSVLRSSHQSQLDYPLVPFSTRSLGMGTEVTSWHVREPQREAYSVLQSFPTTKRSFSSFLAKEGDTVEDSMKPNSSSNDRVDQCPSSNFLYTNASRHEMTHTVEENSVEVCTPLRKPLQEEMNGMSTSEAECMSRKRLWVEDGVAHDGGCRASFSSQEECSPACRLNPIQAVLCKLQRPAFSCGLKQSTLPEYGIRKVENVLLKLQRPTSHPIHGLGHHDAEANGTIQMDMRQTSDMDHKSNLDLEIKPTAECQDRLLTYHNTSGSRGSLPLLNALKPTRLSSKEGEDKRGLSEISTLRNKESKLSLDDIDAIASTDYRFSNQPYQRTSQSKAHSLPSVVRIKEVADSSVPRAGNAKQCSFPISERNPVFEVTDRKQPSRRNSDPPVSHTGGLESSSNTPQASEKPKTVEASEEQESLHNNQHNPPVSENHILSSRSPTSTSRDADYVKMLESYVVQLKLENDILRLWTCS